MDAPNINPYPGFNSTGEFNTPRRPPRIRKEAEEFAQKNAGSINLFVDEKNKHTTEGPPPSPRCLSHEARQNYEKGRNGQISGLLRGGGPVPESETVPNGRAVKPEAREIAEQHKGGTMCQLLVQDSSMPMSSRRKPRVTLQASETAELARGVTMNSLMHNPKAIPEEQRTKPRVTTDEAKRVAELGGGSQMGKVMFQYGTDQTPRRKKPETEKDQLNQGKRMDTIFKEYGSRPASARAPPELRKSMMSRLMHEGDTLPSDPKKQIRAASASGRRIMRKMHASSITQVFAENSKWQVVPTAGVRGKVH